MKRDEQVRQTQIGLSMLVGALTLVVLMSKIVMSGVGWGAGGPLARRAGPAAAMLPRS